MSGRRMMMAGGEKETPILAIISNHSQWIDTGVVYDPTKTYHISAIISVESTGLLQVVHGWDNGGNVAFYYYSSQRAYALPAYSSSSWIAFGYVKNTSDSSPKCFRVVRDTTINAATTPNKPVISSILDTNIYGGMAHDERTLNSRYVNIPSTIGTHTLFGCRLLDGTVKLNNDDVWAGIYKYQIEEDGVIIRDFEPTLVGEKPVLKDKCGSISSKTGTSYYISETDEDFEFFTDEYNRLEKLNKLGIRLIGDVSFI